LLSLPEYPKKMNNLLEQFILIFFSILIFRWSIFFLTPAPSTRHPTYILWLEAILNNEKVNLQIHLRTIHHLSATLQLLSLRLLLRLFEQFFLCLFLLKKLHTIFQRFLR